MMFLRKRFQKNPEPTYLSPKSYLIRNRIPFIRAHRNGWVMDKINRQNATDHGIPSFHLGP